MSDWEFLNAARISRGSYASDPSYGFNGLFEFRLPDEPRPIRCLASDGMGWQHVSVSHGASATKCPSWPTMCAIKALFWEDEDVVVQFHPAKSQYVNFHLACLHLWRCTDGREQPIPPSLLVGPRTKATDGTL